MNKISRKGFLKIAAAAAMSGVTAGALAACNAAKDSAAASSAVSAPAGSYIPGTYEGTADRSVDNVEPEAAARNVLEALGWPIA